MTDTGRKGGANNEDNLVLCCGLCNQNKGNNDPDVFRDGEYYVAR